MKKTFLVILLLNCVLLSAALAQEQPPPQGPAEATPAPPPPKAGVTDRMFFGGGIGFGFGDVDWVEISPMVGVRVIPRLSLGLGLTYRHSTDSRYDPELSTSDFGGDVFAQVTLFRNVFAMAEYEVMNYEYYGSTGEKTSDTFNSTFVGGGIFQPLGGHASLVLSALYNLSYSSDEPSPYGSPWVVSAGVSVGF